MNSMPATETAASAAPTPLALETSAGNERMRHIPTLEWMVAKLEGDVRRRLDMVLEVYHALHFDDPRHADLEGPLRSLCRCIDKLAEAARHGRSNHPPNEIGAHLHWSLEHAAANMRGIDGEIFGRRAPFHYFDRSRSEPIYGALLAVLSSMERTLAVARAIDPTLDERLYAHLVTLQVPMRCEPIA
jgi:hypothetical protein